MSNYEQGWIDASKGRKAQAWHSLAYRNGYRDGKQYGWYPY